MKACKSGIKTSSRSEHINRYLFVLFGWGLCILGSSLETRTGVFLSKEVALGSLSSKTSTETT